MPSDCWVCVCCSPMSFNSLSQWQHTPMEIMDLHINPPSKPKGPKGWSWLHWLSHVTHKWPTHNAWSFREAAVTQITTLYYHATAIQSDQCVAPTSRTTLHFNSNFNDHPSLQTWIQSSICDWLLQCGFRVLNKVLSECAHCRLQIGMRITTWWRTKGWIYLTSLQCIASFCPLRLPPLFLFLTEPQGTPNPTSTFPSQSNLGRGCSDVSGHLAGFI